jgi:hypothetical protein
MSYELQIERAVLDVILGLHPDHLTPDELVLKIAADQNPSERIDIPEAIRALRRSGLIRDRCGVVEPTHAALCAMALLRF